MATNFLEALGTNGYIATPFAFVTTEFSGNNTVVTTGVRTFTQTSGSQAQAIWGSVYFMAGGAFTPLAGGYIAAWFLKSPNGGVSFESSPGANQGLARIPDFIVPLNAVAYASGTISWCQAPIVQLPWEPYRLYAQNLSGSGVSIPVSSSLNVGPVAVQY